MLFNRLLTLPLSGTSSIFLFGPRGTGKTSWIKEHLSDSLYLDLLDFSLYSLLVADPSRLETLIPPRYEKWIVIDEVQRIPELLNEVHRLIETYQYRFLLTGSSARSLRKQGVNLLAGRALTYYMHPLVIQEVGEQFNLAHAGNYGLLPAAVSHQDPKKYLESYVQTYIREEVLQEGITRNIGVFSRFLEIASFSQGIVLNYSHIGRELGLNRAIVYNYFTILEDLLIGVKLLPFSQRAKRKLVAHQKFYFFDTGIYKTLRSMGPLDMPEAIEGVALETLFFQSLQAINDYLELGYTLTFWRTHTGQEVDFVLYGPKGFHAFEVKRSSKVTGTNLKGLKSFQKDYPEAQLYLIFLGKHVEYHENITVFPFVQALEELPKLLG